MSVGDPFDLDRFVSAQDADGTYRRALDELRAGRKRSHWMWFVFPQLAGLGRSATAQRYALASVAEARAYLAHPVLGERLRDSARAAMDSGVSAGRLFGAVDAQKLRSSATLFALVDEWFDAVLDHFFAGDRDDATLRLLGQTG